MEDVEFRERTKVRVREEDPEGGVPTKEGSEEGTVEDTGLHVSKRLGVVSHGVGTVGKLVREVRLRRAKVCHLDSGS